MLRKQIFDAEQLEAIIRDFGMPDSILGGGVMEFAEKITLHAHAIQKKDVDKLRENGLTDEEIL